ncbi:major facilitator superfamily transporter [Nocardia nova SH22a]|uniref:Major facilitator superfamily transporter n=1 Tax=Nocardia nova SH22a TaxID=1415166 RepID=W5THW0_9NOCA|nr:MFS transporter [Nocardia nova]AHH18754.1 major facilitator superfamily transporter [Nocardia nova SH22a]
MSSLREVTKTVPERRAGTGWMVAALMLGVLVYGVLGTVVTPALTLLQNDLHTSVGGVTWLLTAYLLAAAVSTAVLGRLGDMFGKRRMLLVALTLMAAGTLVSAVSGVFAVVVLGRVLQGMAGGLLPLAFGIIRDELPGDRIGHAIGAVSAMIGVGTGVGVILPGLVATSMGWQWLFWIPFALTVLAMIGTRVFVSESPVRPGGRVNWVNATLLTVGITAVLIAVSEGASWGWTSGPTLGLLLGGAAVCALWATAESVSSAPLITVSLMRVRALWTTNITAFLLGAAMFSSTAVYPIFAQLPTGSGFGYGASPLVCGLYMLPYSVAIAVAGALAGRIARRLGFLPALVAGCLTCAAGSGYIAVRYHHPLDMMISLVIFGFGLGTATSALAAVVVHAAPAGRVGETTGMNQVIRMIGGAVGTQVVSTLIAGNRHNGIPALSGFTQSFLAEAVFLIVAAGAAVLAVPRR